MTCSFVQEATRYTGFQVLPKNKQKTVFTWMHKISSCELTATLKQVTSQRSLCQQLQLIPIPAKFIDLII